jgi:hypothetical protein
MDVHATFCTLMQRSALVDRLLSASCMHGLASFQLFDEVFGTILSAQVHTHEAHVNVSRYQSILIGIATAGAKTQGPHVNVYMHQGT